MCPPKNLCVPPQSVFASYGPDKAISVVGRVTVTTLYKSISVVGTVTVTTLYKAISVVGTVTDTTLYKSISV